MVRGIGDHIQQAAQNFIQSFQIGKQLEDQAKDKKKAPLLEALKYAMSDDDLPMSKRTEFFRQYIDVATDGKGTRDNPHLEDLLRGLHEVEGQDVKTGNTIQKSVSPNQEEINAQSSGPIPDSQLETPPTMTYQGDETVKRGNLSPNEFKSIRARIAARQGNEDELKQQERLAEINSRIQEKFLTKHGYEKSPETVYEATSGRSWQVYTNPNATSQDEQVKYIPLGIYKDENGNPITKPIESVETESTRNKKLQADMTRGELGTFEKAQEIVDNPSSYSPSQVKAAQNYIDKQKAITTNQVNRTTGDIPLTTDQEARLKLEREKFTEQINKQNTQRQQELEDDITEAESIMTEADQEAKDAKAQKAKIHERFGFVKSRLGYLTSKSPDDLSDDEKSEIKELNTERQRIEDDLRGIETRESKASGVYNRAKEKRDKKRQALRQIGGTYASSSLQTPGSGATETVFSEDGSIKEAPSAIIALIADFRKANPSIKSDTEAYQVLDSAGRLDKFK